MANAVAARPAGVRLPAIRPAAAVFLAVAFANAPAAQAQQGASDGAGLAWDIVVTAQRRTERLTDVPLAITALSSDQIEAASVRDLRGLQILVPSLVLTQTNSEQNGTSIRIRGFGTSANNAGLEAAVGVFVDGVYRSRSGLAMSDLIDLERIEVLRGPQGTLFGRNTSAGAISIVTRAPGFETTGFLEASLGSDDLRRLDAMVNLPLSDRLAVRLTGSGTLRDGFFEDVLTGVTYNNRRRYNLRGQLLWRPSEATSLRVVLDHSDRDERCCISGFLTIGPTSRAAEALGAVFPTDDPFDREVALDRPLTSTSSDWGVSAELAIETGVARLTAIGAYRDFRSNQAFDFDFINVDLAIGPGSRLDIRLFSQELRLTGNAGALDWLVGAYYANERLLRTDPRLFGDDLAALFRVPPAFLPPGRGSLDERYRQTSDNMALFTHNRIALGGGFGLVAGLRYTDETKRASARFETESPGCPLLPLLCAVPDYDAGVSEGELTGVATLTYGAESRRLVYVTYARGYKAGGINLQREAAVVVLNNPNIAGDPRFEPEFATSWEAGLRFAGLPGRGRVGLTAFHTRFTDFQSLRFVNGITATIVNAPSATSKGLEAEAAFQPADWLSLAGSAALVDARYGDSLSESSDPTLARLAGLRIENAPLWTISGSIDVSQPLGSLPLAVAANLSGRYESASRTASDPTQPGRQAPFAIFNGRIGVASDDGRFGVDLWATNLFNARFHTLTFPVPLQTGTFAQYLGEPRTWGITLRLRP
jgi:outer membrane receptor protein involved in Fe transport